MQPASDAPRGGSGSSMRRWGPIAAIVVVLAVIIGVVVVGSGDDDEEEQATAGGDGATEGTTEVTTADGDVRYPLSFRDAQEAGLDGLDWGERCDTERGQLAIPSYYAAECFLPFEGDNGGATHRGVTADAVNVVVYVAPDADPVLDYITDAINNDDTGDDVADTIAKHVEMLNTYYEFYGRKIDVEFYRSTGTSADAAAARADAVKIDEEMDPFVVLGGPALTAAFGEELNARGIMCYGCGGGGVTREQILEERNAEQALYWGGTMDNEQLRAHNVEVLVNQVAGRPAEYAGDETMHDRERVFGYLYIESSAESAENAQAYADALAEEGVELAAMVPYALDPATLQETAANAITRMKDAGVTTVIFAGDPIAPRDFTREATAQNYFPEWFLNLSTLIDTNVFSRTYDQQQWAHAFGITPLSTRIDSEAFGEITGRKVYEWFHGEEPAAIDTIGVLLPAPDWLAAMLQHAGPNLTYETFEEGAFRYTPVREGVIERYTTYGDHGLWDRLEGPDYEGVDDVTKIWWDPEDVAKDEIQSEGPGVWQFVNGGERFFVDEWEEGEFGAFDPEGAVGVLDEAPASEAPPIYDPLPNTGRS